MNSINLKAKKFIYRNARPLEYARWQYHFEEGTQEAVVHALGAYQNTDGGFGHALEADSWNPNSSPIQTWAATQILREIKFGDVNHPVVLGLVAYLTSRVDFDGHFWRNTIASNDDFPHAPWWHYDDACAPTYNPTAALAGFLLRFAPEASEAQYLATKLVKEAVTHFMAGPMLEDMHVVACYVSLLEDIKSVGGFDLVDVDEFEKKLRKQVVTSITQDTSLWQTSYICKPSQFIHSPSSPFYKDNEQISKFEIQFIKESQLADGSWPIPWGWSDYPKEWAISENWWKSHNIISNLLFIKEMDSI